jgi:predicted transcriptional regulator
MPHINDFLDKTGLTDKSIAEKAKISESTLRKIKQGKYVRRRYVGRLLRMLSDELKQQIDFKDIEGVVTDVNGTDESDISTPDTE